jgi:DNA-binding transcriptional ArsR family regulator
MFLLYLTKEESGADLPETDEYAEIFAALKHPIRRQILLFLEQKGEVSFTDIQNATGINDTGLISYHLKELSPLVEQSERGKYRLSEVGQASVRLFRKVENEKQRTSIAVHREIEKSIGQIVFLFLIIGISLIVPLSADIYLSVQNIYQTSLSIEQMTSMFFASFFGMIFGVVLFAFYDRHYFSGLLKQALFHSTIFAVAIALLSILSVYAIYYFDEATLTMGSSFTNSTIWLLGLVRAISFLGSAPPLTYALNKTLIRR